MSFETVKKFYVDWLHKQLLFVLTLTFILGMCAGIYGGKLLYEWRLKQAIVLKGFVYEKEVFDVKLRP